MIPARTAFLFSPSDRRSEKMLSWDKGEVLMVIKPNLSCFHKVFPLLWITTTTDSRHVNTDSSELFTREVWLGHEVQWRSGCAGCFSLSCLKWATWFKRWLNEAAAVRQREPDCVHRARLLTGAQTYQQSASWCNLPSDLGQNICRVQRQTAGLRRWAGSGLLCSGLHGPERSCLCTHAAVDQDHRVCVDRREQTYPDQLCSSRMYNPAGWLWDPDHTGALHSDLPGLWWAQWGKQLDTLLGKQTGDLDGFKASTQQLLSFQGRILYCDKHLLTCL